MSLQMGFEINRFSPLCCYQTFRVSTLGTAVIIWLGGKGRKEGEIPARRGFGAGSIFMAGPGMGFWGRGSDLSEILYFYFSFEDGAGEKERTPSRG